MPISQPPSVRTLLPKVAVPLLALAVQCVLRIGAQAAPEGWNDVRPLLEQHCYECHGGKKTKGGVNLKKLEGDPQFGREYELWDKVRHSIVEGDMPPEDEKPLPDGEKEKTIKWLTHSLEAAARANAGDPGVVTMRRLTNAEYDRTIRDLTGHDYNLAADFSPDGGGGEGFSNIGDVLFISPQQLDKYFAAARKLADHTTILPGSGISFQPQRVGLRGPEQLRSQTEQALYVWYQKMAAPYLPKDDEDMREADYMLACWKFKHREQTGATSLEQLAKEAELFLPFLENWWKLVNSEQPKSRFLDLTRVAWRELPGPDAAKPREVPAVVREKIATIQAHRRSWLGPAHRPSAGVQRRQQDADGLRPQQLQAEVAGRKKVHLVAGDLGDGSTGDLVLFSGLRLERGKESEPYVRWLRRRLDGDRKALAAIEAGGPGDMAPVKARIAEAETVLAKFGKHPFGREIEPEVLAMQAPLVLTLPLPDNATRFRGVGKLDLDSPGSDEATIQWTATADTPPDPTKIIPGVITIWKRQTTAARRTMGDFSVMKAAFPDEYARRLEEVSRNYLRGGKGIGVYFFNDDQLTALIPPEEKRRWEKMMADWKLVRPRQLNANQGKEWDDALKRHLVAFASLAWRRPLASEETAQLASLYDAARARDLDRESAGREVLVRVLVSPKFLFKVEDSTQPGERQLTAWELATRLSYLIWASSPDAALRAAAADGSLLRPEVLVRETKRMLRDPRANALAEEFAGQWLKFNGFKKGANIDANKFPEFTAELRGDMYRETIEFFTHLLREDRPVREILTADYTFLNERLATFYGIPGVKGDEFRKVTVAQYQRGGVLGMGTVLANTSYPHRTSPVLRGHWLLDSILGMPTPPPPNDVPKLDDSVSKAATLRERFERHRADKACASCHDKIDPLGFSMEGFDAIGRLRTKDEAGLEIDDSAQWKDGMEFRGFHGLRKFLATREGDFTEHFCRKLVGYALGRSVLPTDKLLIEKMRDELTKGDGRISTALLAVAQSRQFQNRRND